MDRRTLLTLAAVLAAAAVAGSCEKPLALHTGTSLLTVAPKSATLHTDQTLDLTAVALTTSGDTATVTVTWSVTSGSMIDTSTTGGKHQGRYKAGTAPGQVKVVAAGHPGSQSDTAVVTVTPVPVMSVSISPASATVLVGQTTQLTATPKDSAGDTLTGRTVTWGSNNTGVATVSATGLVTGKAAGTAIVTASSEGKANVAPVTVTLVRVAAVTVSPSSANLFVGQTVQLTATPKDSAGNPLAGRVVSWASNATGVARVSASGQVTGVTAGAATVTATVEGVSVSAAITVTLAPVASVVVSPSAANLSVGQTLQLTATPKDSAGNTLTGRAVSWASSPTAVATVNASGLVTGVTVGAATVTATSESKSGTSAITVTTPPPPPTGSCLTQTGPTVTLSGLHTANYENTNLAAYTKIDASTAQFMTGTKIPIHIAGSYVCWHGADIIGQWAPSTPWTYAYTTYGIVVSGPNMTVENVWMFNYGNGVSMDQNGTDFTVRSSYFPYGRDGSIENDFDLNGTVDDVLIESYLPFASEEYVSGVDGSNNLETIKNSLVHLVPMDGVYSGPLPGSAGMYVWGAKAPKLALYNNIFRVDQNSNEQYLAPPPGKLADCQNNIMIWLGSGPFPETLPLTFNGKQCFTLMTGQAGLDYWNNAVVQWKANHPNLLPDIGPPVISLFSPGVVGSSTLTGTVSLTATAADDRAVSGVQFQLNGQNIGAELTTDSPFSKYRISWDSRSVANGTYTLTATARDPAGHATTSAGVTVTVSN